MEQLPCALPPSHVVVFFFLSSLCFPLKHCLTSPPAFHTPFYVSFSSMLYHPLMLLLWSVFMISLCLSLYRALGMLQRKTSRLTVIHCDASISLVAGTVLAWRYTHAETHARRAAFPVQSLLYSLVHPHPHPLPLPWYQRGSRTGSKHTWAAVLLCD